MLLQANDRDQIQGSNGREFAEVQSASVASAMGKKLAEMNPWL